MYILALPKPSSFPQVYNDSPCAVLGLQGPVTSSGLNKVAFFMPCPAGWIKHLQKINRFLSLWGKNM